MRYRRRSRRHLSGAEAVPAKGCPPAHPRHRRRKNQSRASRTIDAEQRHAVRVRFGHDVPSPVPSLGHCRFGCCRASSWRSPAVFWQLRRADYFWRNPMAGARTERVTDFEGEEADVAISPDGKFIVFLADRAGRFDVWLNQIGTSAFVNVTKGMIPTVKSSCDSKSWVCRRRRVKSGFPKVRDPVRIRSGSRRCWAASLVVFWLTSWSRCGRLTEMQWLIIRPNPAIPSLSQTAVDAVRKNLHCGARLSLSLSDMVAGWPLSLLRHGHSDDR